MLCYYVLLLFCIVRLNFIAIANVRASTFVLVSSKRPRQREDLGLADFSPFPHSTPSLLDVNGQFEGCKYDIYPTEKRMLPLLSIHLRRCGSPAYCLDWVLTM